ncbi:hypothetical protein F8388_000243 [Cannabis sativa]|uniref:Uncharacterized protein n=1 Tax=Cannabis sativa TaxID=3483 RepID=A0A7J6DR38_CANSA|nr:hypothetical protein F8388_000243 [Cannabis sativa]
MTGFEPVTFCTQNKRATELRYIPFNWSTGFCVEIQVSVINYIYASVSICISIMYYKLRRILNARSKNISFRGTGSKYYMVWVFSRIIDRDQSFISGCVDIPLFLMIVIGKG